MQTTFTDLKLTRVFSLLIGVHCHGLVLMPCSSMTFIRQDRPISKRFVFVDNSLKQKKSLSTFYTRYTIPIILNIP